MCSSVVLFSKQDYKLAEIIKFICRENRSNLTFCRTLPDLIYLAFNSMPEVVIHDDESIKFIPRIFKDFTESQNFKMPTYIILTNNVSEYANVENVIVLNKADCVNELNQIIKNAKEKTFCSLTSQQKLELNEKLNLYLNNFGITTKYLGFGYIKELVLNIIEDKRNLKSFNTKLYPQIASKYNTQATNIERNVRNAISIAVESTKNNKVFEEFIHHFKRRVPSNKQFISYLAEKVAN